MPPLIPTTSTLSLCEAGAVQEAVEWPHHQLPDLFSSDRTAFDSFSYFVSLFPEWSPNDLYSQVHVRIRIEWNLSVYVMGNPTLFNVFSHGSMQQ